MPTTFNVFFLGNRADIDTVDGNNTAENAAALVGLTVGTIANPILNNASVFAPGPTGFGGGTTDAYDMDNTPAETFTINGGSPQTFDSSVIYNATITYLDGTTATVTAVVFQDTAGNTYWSSEITANADQTAMNAAPIRSITLDSLAGDTFSGMAGNRQTWDYLICYVGGTRILTPHGECRVEDLRIGDAVMTRDNGAQRIRWIGVSCVIGLGKCAPIRIEKGALGRGLPRRDLRVSRQHRMLLRSRVVERMFGSPEVLVPAIKLVGMPGIDPAPTAGPVSYYHLLTDAHEIIFAEGAESETLLTGPQARTTMGAEAVEELETLFPGLIDRVAVPARPVARNAKVSRMLERHRRNAVGLV